MEPLSRKFFTIFLIESAKFGKFISFDTVEINNVNFLRFRKAEKLDKLLNADNPSIRKNHMYPKKAHL